MAATYTLITSTTLASTTTSIAFTSIPSTYSDLVLRGSARGLNTNPGGDPIYAMFNGESIGATGYSLVYYFGNSSTVASSKVTSYGATDLLYAITENGTTANTYSNFEWYLPNYAISTINKPSRSFAVSEANSSTTNAYQGIAANLKASNAAISSITLSFGSGSDTFAIGSSFYLYGIKNS